MRKLLALSVVLFLLLPGCKKGAESGQGREKATGQAAQPAKTPQPRFMMRANDPIDLHDSSHVIVTGTVDRGTVKVGDKLLVKTARGSIPVEVEVISESRSPTTMPEAGAGVEVGLMLLGITQDQVHDGDSVESVD